MRDAVARWTFDVAVLLGAVATVVAVFAGVGCSYCECPGIVTLVEPGVYKIDEQASGFEHVDGAEVQLTEDAVTIEYEIEDTGELVTVVYLVVGSYEDSSY